MKIKKNEIAVFQEVYETSYGFEKGDYIYFNRNSVELKTLRSNSKNFSYWDGNNWKHIQVKFCEILIYDEEIEYDEHGEPAYSFECRYKIGNEILCLSQSNCSGHLTPFYTENWHR